MYYSCECDWLRRPPHPLITAIQNNDLKRFEEELENAPDCIIYCALDHALSKNTPRSLEYAVPLLQHPRAKVYDYSLRSMLENTITFDEEVFELALIALRDSLESVFWYATQVPNYKAITILMRKMIHEVRVTDEQLFEILDGYMVRPVASKFPKQHVHALVEAGVDLRKFPMLLPRSLSHQRPGIGRELIAAGISVNAAYDPTMMKYRWYRKALIDDLGHVV